MFHRIRAFSLIELIIVVLIIGILAAIVVPRFTNASDKARDSSARTTLTYLRNQIELFKTNHGNMPPQAGALWSLLQKSSSSAETATVNPTGTQFGPYLKSDPLNPWNNFTTANSAAVDVNAGWYYNASPTSYELRLRNLDGSVNYQY
jgi:general secretion pathway protein G